MSRRKLCSLVVISLSIVANQTRAEEDPRKHPQPKNVRPGQVVEGIAMTPPEDAVVLFNGRDHSQFTDIKGNPVRWKVADGELQVGGGDIMSKSTFSDAQFHVEFSTKNVGKRHANSGLYFHHLYEIQIFESHTENPHSPGQQCGAIYQTYRPLVNASLPPGQWQTFDIVFHGVKLNEDGTVRVPARFTVFHNGVLIQYNRSLRRGTGAGSGREMVERGPLRIQAHGGDVRFRNIWFRHIPPISAATAGSLNKPRPRGNATRVGPALAGTVGFPGKLPSDAVVLFDGKTLDRWVRSNDRTRPANWLVRDGHTRVGDDTIITKKPFGDVQLHLEWATPADVKGSGQGRGNSGIKMELVNEVQVLDSYTNETYPDGHAGAIYGQYAPLVNASRPPGKWQSYDIVYRTAKYDKGGSVTGPGSFTLLHNGILVQDHVRLKWPRNRGPQNGEPVVGPILLQSKGAPVLYRNIWLRQLVPQNAEPPDIAPSVRRPKQFVYDGKRVILQAEDADVDGAGIISTNPGYTGTGFVDFRAAKEETIIWSVGSKQAADCTLTIRYSTGNPDQPLRLSVNGKVLTERVPFPGTADWATWRDVSQDVNLAAGVNTIELRSIGNSGPNVDCLILSASR